MLRQIRELGTYRLHATDGDIGHLEQFYFDDRDWKIKYFVVDIGTWLHGKKVLMSPDSIVGVDAKTRTINAAFNKQQVEESDDIAMHKPEGLEQRHDYSLYLGWPYYLGLNDSERGPDAGLAHDPRKSLRHSFRQEYDEHLRSSKIVSRYHVMAVDGEIGQIEDGIVDDQTWAIQYLVSTVRNWWSSKTVLLPTELISWIHAAESNVYVRLKQEHIANAPAFDPGKPLTHDFEIKLHNHYWDSLPKPEPTRISKASLSSVVSLFEALEERNYRSHKR